MNGAPFTIGRVSRRINGILAALPKLTAPPTPGGPRSSGSRRLRLIHLPIHASWLNQIELYFSIVQHKALTPNDYGSPQEIAERLLAFQARYVEIARPFE